MHDILVVYDVSTETKQGRKRLRQVANICNAFGQRVQNSVFECHVTPGQFEELESRLVAIMDPTEDSIRLYQLPANYEASVRIHGLVPEFDLRQPLII